MQDCEIVLRYFAFRKRSNIKGSVRAMLDRCMVEHLHTDQAELDRFAKDFKDRLTLASGIFGDKVFRYEDEDGKWQLSVPLYDGVMIAIDRLWDKRKKLQSARTLVMQKVARLLKNEDAFEVIKGRPNTAKAVQRRMDILTKAIESAI